MFCLSTIRDQSDQICQSIPRGTLEGSPGQEVKQKHDDTQKMVREM